MNRNIKIGDKVKTNLSPSFYDIVSEKKVSNRINFIDFSKNAIPITSQAINSITDTTYIV